MEVKEWYVSDLEAVSRGNNLGDVELGGLEARGIRGALIRCLGCSFPTRTRGLRRAAELEEEEVEEEEEEEGEEK